MKSIKPGSKKQCYIELPPIKVILCASEQMCSIVRYCYMSFEQLQQDP